MKLTVDIEFERNQLPSIYACLAELPTKLVPKTFAIDETSTRSPISVETLRCGSGPLVEISGGVSLFAEDAEFHVSYPETGPSSVFALCESDDVARALMVAFAQLRIEFGYACDQQERIHRNRVFSKKKYGSHEAWVGRNYEIYLPGIYWISIVPSSLLERHGIAISQFQDIAHSVQKISEDNYLIELYELSSEWETRADAVDEWCRLTSGCFHKAEAQAALSAAGTFLEASDATVPWK